MKKYYLAVCFVVSLIGSQSALSGGNIIAVLDCGKLDDDVFPEYREHDKKFGDSSSYKKQEKLILIIQEGFIIRDCQAPASTKKANCPTIKISVYDSIGSVGESIEDDGTIVGYGVSTITGHIKRDARFEIPMLWKDPVMQLVGYKYKKTPRIRSWYLDRVTGSLKVTNEHKKTGDIKKITRQCKRVELLF